MKKFKIVILTDSNLLQAWELGCLQDLHEQGLSDIVLEVRNRTPKPSGKKSPFFYRIYRAIDRGIFYSNPDAFQRKDIQASLGLEIPLLEVSPIQNTYRDSFLQSDLEQISDANPDIILRFGFRILTGKILTLPRLGAWSFHHGDPASYRGGPPAFWEVMLGLETTGTVLQRLTENLDQGDVLYQSYSHTDPLSVQRNANSIFWNSSYFVSRVLSSITQLGEEKWAEKLATQKNKSPLKTPPGNLQMIALFWQLISRNLWRKIQENRKPAHWELALVNHTDPTAIKTSDVRLIAHADDAKSYLADPFPIHHKVKTYVFAEKYDKQSKKGSIVCGRMEGNTLHDLQTVIVEDWHLSYPFVLKEDETYFMIPESASAGKLYFYQASTFPYQWERKAVFFEGEAFDPTLYYADGKWWLFVNEKQHPATSPFDELNLYFCDSLHSLHWNAHPMNPIVSDVRSSRPAGKLFHKDGKLYRPAQDSGKRYGHRIAVQEVLEITERSYRERTAYWIEPKLVEGALGVHTLNYCEDKMFLDFYFRK